MEPIIAVNQMTDEQIADELVKIDKEISAIDRMIGETESRMNALTKSLRYFETRRFNLKLGLYSNGPPLKETEKSGVAASQRLSG